MDTNKMRAEFEAAYAAKSTARNGRFYPEVLTRGDDGDYVIPSVQSAWWAWQASREAVVVELPSEDTCRTSTSKEEAAQDAYNHALGECRSVIEAQGLKVAP